MPCLTQGLTTQRPSIFLSGANRAASQSGAEVEKNGAGLVGFADRFEGR
jgi:hypothetical protein